MSKSVRAGSDEAASLVDLDELLGPGDAANISRTAIAGHDIARHRIWQQQKSPGDLSVQDDRSLFSVPDEPALRDTFHKRLTRFKDDFIAPFDRYELTDAAVLGGGLVALLDVPAVLTAHNLVSSPGRILHPRFLRRAARRHDGKIAIAAANRIELTRPCVALAQPGTHIFGHWLVDILPRLLYHLRHCDGGEHFLFPQEAKKLLAMFNRYLKIPEDRLHFYDADTDLVCAPRVILYSSIHTSDFFHSRSETIFDDFRSYLPARNSDLPAASAEKIFVSRSKLPAKARQLINRRHVEEVFAGCGFQIVHPQQMAFHDQVAMVRGAKVLAGEYGSGLHTSLFAPGLRKIVLASLGNGALMEYGISRLRRQPTFIMPGSQLSICDQSAISNNFVISTRHLQAELVKAALGDLQ